MVKDEGDANATPIETTINEEQTDTEERNMEQLMAAADSAAEPAPASPDKDSSTITIFNENSEVCYAIFLQLSVLKQVFFSGFVT